MEENKNIILVINSILNKKLFYSNNDSLLQNSLNRFHNLFNESSIENLNSFLAEQGNNNLLLSEQNLKNLKKVIKDKYFDIENLNLKDDEILREYKEIKPLNHVLPFNYLSSLVIDKQFFKNIDINDHSEIRRKLLSITKFIQEMKSDGILVKDVNFEFSYIDDGNKNSGFCNKNKIYIQCNQLSSSSLKHEYFHAMDINLAKKLNIETSENKITFSDFNKPSEKLKEFNSFIKNLDKNNSTKEETYNNIKLYFEKYLPDLNKDLTKITPKDIDKEINKVVGDIYTDGKGNSESPRPKGRGFFF